MLDGDPGPVNTGTATLEVAISTHTTTAQQPRELTQGEYTEMIFHDSLREVHRAERALFDENSPNKDRGEQLIQAQRRAAAALTRKIVTVLSKDESMRGKKVEEILDLKSNESEPISDGSIITIQSLVIMQFAKAVADAGGNGIMKGVAYDTKEHNRALAETSDVGAI